MERAEAVELAEKWLRAEGMGLNEPDGVRVEHERVRRTPEGWCIPWGKVAYLDHGDIGQQIFPPPELIVSEPEGWLWHANTTPHPAYPVLADWPGEPKYRALIDPEYKEAGLYDLGVPQEVVAGWEITHPDGRTEEKVNPKFRIGPVRAGLPRPQNKLEVLLGYWELGFAQDRFLAGLLGTEVLVPLKDDADEIHDSARSAPGMLAVYSSPRQVQKAIRWWRMTVPTFVARYPGTGMVINEGRFPARTVTAAELAEVSAARPGYRPAEPVVVTEPGLDGSLDEYAAQLQRDFRLPFPPRLLPREVVAARDSGRGLTLEERRKLLLGKAWLLRPENSGKLVGRVVDGSAEDELAAASWPEDLPANGLVATHDSAGRLRPARSTFGKFPRASEFDPNAWWHAVVGAYVGFAVGDALGAPVDRLSWQEIQQRFGEQGVTGLETAFEQPGQVSWRTQQLLFLTEGVVSTERSQALDLDALSLATRAAHARWLVTQGVPWEQAAGPLAAEHPEPDGRLVRIRDLRARRGMAPEMLDKIRAAVATPRADHGLNGPMKLTWALPGAVARWDGPVTAGWHQRPIDSEAGRVLAEVFQNLFRREDFVHPVWSQLHTIGQRLVQRKPEGAAEQVANVVVDVRSRVHDYLGAGDHRDMEAFGDGTDTLSVFGRALLLAGKWEAYPRKALLTAVNHSGRSALTGALVGALVGARAGVAGFPREWVTALDIGDLVEEIASDAYWRFARYNPYYEHEQDMREWDRRYPRWKPQQVSPSADFG